MAHTSPQGSQKQSPPPYTSQQTESEVFLDELVQAEQQKKIERTARNRLSSPEIETDRLRNMLMYTLSVDYQGTPDTALSAGDREHFTDLHNMLQDLHRAHDNAKPTNAERKELAPYFWKYLHEPCRELGVPVDMVLARINGLVHFVNLHGCYKGSCFGDLHSEGLAYLAVKLWFDQTVLIPAVFKRGPRRQKMLAGVTGVRRLFFNSISGIDGATLDHTGFRRWKDYQKVVYEANERGLSYEKLRQQATTSSILSLSLRFVSLQAKRCVKKIFERHEQVKARKRTPDTPKTWRGDGHPDLTATNGHTGEYFERGRPNDWWTRPTFHLPDFFEGRDVKDNNDV